MTDAKLQNILESIEFYLEGKNSCLLAKELVTNSPDIDIDSEEAKELLATIREQEKAFDELEKRYFGYTLEYPEYKESIYEKLGVTIN